MVAIDIYNRWMIWTIHFAIRKCPNLRLTHRKSNRRNGKNWKFILHSDCLFPFLSLSLLFSLYFWNLCTHTQPQQSMNIFCYLVLSKNFTIQSFTVAIHLIAELKMTIKLIEKIGREKNKTSTAENKKLINFYSFQNRKIANNILNEAHDIVFDRQTKTTTMVGGRECFSFFAQYTVFLLMFGQCLA